MGGWLGRIFPSAALGKIFPRERGWEKIFPGSVKRGESVAAEIDNLQQHNMDKRRHDDSAAPKHYYLCHLKNHADPPVLGVQRDGDVIRIFGSNRDDGFVVAQNLHTIDGQLSVQNTVEHGGDFYHLVCVDSRAGVVHDERCPIS